jgi:hypothetical protein
MHWSKEIKKPTPIRYDIGDAGSLIAIANVVPIKLFQYDQLSKLDKWKTTLLLRVKTAVEKQEEDFS